MSGAAPTTRRDSTSDFDGQEAWLLEQLDRLGARPIGA